MPYLEPEAYSEHCQTPSMECFCKKQLLSTLKKSSYTFRKWKFLEIFSYISGNKTFLYFTKRKPRKSCSYIWRNGTPKKLLTFQVMELSYISGSKKNPLLIRRNNNKIDSIENWSITSWFYWILLLNY